jgi:hypothetical protein
MDWKKIIKKNGLMDRCVDLIAALRIAYSKKDTEKYCVWVIF